MDNLRWEDYVFDRLAEIEAGEGRDFWEGEWPAPPTVWQAASQVMGLLPPEAPTPSVVPSLSGEITFVWHKGGWDIELCFSPGDVTYIWMHDRSTGAVLSGPAWMSAENLSLVAHQFRVILCELQDSDFEVTWDE